MIDSQTKSDVLADIDEGVRMGPGLNQIGAGPSININQSQVHTFSGPEPFKHDIQLHQISGKKKKCILFLDCLMGQLEVRSTYLGWTVAFDSDGVFAIELCSSSFSPLNFTPIVMFVQ